MFSDFEKLEKTIVDMVPYAAGRQWQFMGSLFFCAIVITTVGCKSLHFE
jgi:hypothetical protein